MAGPQGFAPAITQHAAAMRRAAAALVGWADAEDVAQEAMLRAWQAWDTLRDEEAARGWLLRITVNVGLQWRRGSFGRQRTHSEPLADARIDELATLETNPGTSDHTGSLDLRSAINTLGQDMRLAVILRYYARMDASEIGEALGVPAATVRTRLRRGLMALHERLGVPAGSGGQNGEEGGKHV